MAKTLTLELSDELAARLAARAEELGIDPNHFAVARLEVGLDMEDTEGTEDEPSPELIADLQRGLEEVATGKTLSLNEAQRKFDLAWSELFGTARK